ncbi:hypothetical protein ISS07_05855 [Candidatus Woesearchaeota archaeon]|nr:hypothetical protein [Candidatus Woesearchaeota archaeon]
MEKKRNHRTFFILLLLAITLFLLLFNFAFKKEISFDIQDKCGVFVNLISHTIVDEDACASRCRGQCVSQDNKFSKIIFEEAEKGCNECTCFCK